MRNKLIEIMQQWGTENTDSFPVESVADYLLKNGVIILPCKVGDELFVLSQMRDKRILPFINKYICTSISIKKHSITVYHEMDGYIKVFKEADFGKTVFLTKEEAEAKLKEIKDE